MISDQIKRHLSVNQDDFYRQLVLSCKSWLPYIQPSEYPVVLFQPAATSHEEQLRKQKKEQAERSTRTFHWLLMLKREKCGEDSSTLCLSRSWEGEKEFQNLLLFFPTLSSCSYLNFSLGAYSKRLQHFQKSFLGLGSKQKFLAGRETGFAFFQGCVNFVLYPIPEGAEHCMAQPYEKLC